MWLGNSEKDYYLGALENPGTSAGAEHASSSLDDEVLTAPEPAAPAGDGPRAGGAHRRKP
jgi:hypothetical protein